MDLVSILIIAVVVLLVLALGFALFTLFRNKSIKQFASLRADSMLEEGARERASSSTPKEDS